MDVAVGQFAARAVQFFNQRAHLRLLGRVGRAHDDGVAAGLGQDAGFVAAVSLACSSGCTSSVHQTAQQRGHVAGDGVLEGNHFHIGGIGHVQRRDDFAQALQVVGVVGDHQCVRTGRHIDGVVRADEWAQHGHQIVGVFVVELEDLRHHLRVVRGAGHHHGVLAALQFRLGLGHHFVQALGFNHRKALQTQHRQKLVPGHLRRHRFLGAEGDGAFHTRVHHQAAFGQTGQGAGHGFNLGIHKIQGDGRCGWFGLRPNGGAQTHAGHQQTSDRGVSVQHAHPHLKTVRLPRR